MFTRHWPILFLLCSACSSSSRPVSTPPEELEAVTLSPRNFVWGSLAKSSETTPTVRSIRVSDFPGAAAVWGATGRDTQGHLWFGVSAEGPGPLSAHLLNYDPVSGERTDHGNAVEQLRRLGLAKPDEQQGKIHSKIWQMSDGYLYFASMDEGGEKSDGSRLPTHGSHLWRVKPGMADWEHLAAVPEAILASAVGGRFVYFLGYFDHVVYQYDPAAQKLASVRAGSNCGHVSRNFLADGNGHIYVPSVNTDRAELVEYNERLQPIHRSNLMYYTITPDETSHGITAWQLMKNGTIYFLTDQGRLYHTTPSTSGPATLKDCGWLHPGGRSYGASLFSPDGETQLQAAVYRPRSTERLYDWVTYDVQTNRSTAKQLNVPDPVIGQWNDMLMYGSITCDDTGRHYLVGRYVTPSPAKSWPAIWQLSW